MVYRDIDRLDGIESGRCNVHRLKFADGDCPECVEEKDAKLRLQNVQEVVAQAYGAIEYESHDGEDHDCGDLLVDYIHTEVTDSTYKGEVNLDDLTGALSSAISDLEAVREALYKLKHEAGGCDA